QERDRLGAAFEQLPGLRSWPSEANFIYCRPTHQSLDEIVQRLQEQGTQVRQTGGGLRITVGTPTENMRTIAHLHQALRS
ncbi:MAG: histidinol-phosphate aminotransferase, partial [Cyanobacteria bacterium P01_C01_bin.70]